MKSTTNIYILADCSFRMQGYEVSLLAYTKIIDDGDDLAALAATAENPVIDGYFYLLNDVESTVDENLHTGYWPNTSNKTLNSACGFKGVLDGNGHVIEYVFNEVGLLANLLEGAIVRNVALIAQRNTEKIGTITPCALAHKSGTNVTVENVYARIANNVINSSRNVVLVATRSTTLKLSNVFVENHTMHKEKNGGALFYADSSRKVATLQENLKNVYVLSSYPFMARWEPAKCIYANNDTADSAYTTENGTITNYTGVTRYDSYQELAAAGATYKGFNETYWDLSLGVPVWKALFEEYEDQFAYPSTLPVETYGQTLEFSALDGELPLTEIFGEEVIILQAYQGVNKLTVSNNKVLGLPTERDCVTETQITVFTAEKGFTINVNAYTKILDDANDFNVFNLTEEKVLDGYYYLTSDVTLPTAFSHEAYWEKVNGKLTFNQEIGFNGVFDGNGHTVSYSFNEWGLFGNILANGTIQNVKLLATRNAEESGVASINGALAHKMWGGAVTNVYAKITDTLSSPNRNASFIGYREYNATAKTYAVLTNVIVESLDTDNALRGGVLFDSDGARNQAATMKDRNVYVLSADTFMARWTASATEKFCYASNDTASGTGVVKYSYVTRYNDVATLANAVTQVGSWAISANGITWQQA